MHLNLTSGLEVRLSHVANRIANSLWMNIVEEIPYLSLDCFHYNIRNYFDAETKTFHNNPGVSVRGSDFGGVGSVDYLCPYLKKKSKYFADWIDYYVKHHSYERGVTFRAAPFDWRLGPVEYAAKGGSFDQTVTLIEDTFRKNGDARVRLVGHSLGAAYLSFFLANHVSKEWKDKYIDSLVSISGPYDGAFTAIRSALMGDPFHQPMKDTPEWITITRAIAGVYWMSPTNSPMMDKPFIHTSKRTFSMNQFEELMREANATNGYQIYKHVSVAEKTKRAPGVPLWCIYGEDLDTPFAWEIPDLLKPTDNVRLLSNVSGDGVVDSLSLRLCDKFADQQSEPVVVWRIPMKEHTELVEMPELWDFVLQNVTRRR